MVFKFSEPAGKLKRNRFEFELDGATVSLPKIDYVPAEADEYLESIRGKGLAQRAFVLGFVEACDAEIGAKMRAQRLTRDQVDEFYDAWVEASKVAPGESSNSSIA